MQKSALNWFLVLEDFLPARTTLYQFLSHRAGYLEETVYIQLYVQRKGKRNYKIVTLADLRTSKLTIWLKKYRNHASLQSYVFFYSCQVFYN